MDFNQILQDIEAEFERARTEDPSHFRSRHEGYAFLEEEVDELWDEVKKKEPPKSIMYEEAKQVAAVAIKFMMDCCEAKEKPCHRCDGTGLFVNSSDSVCGTCKGSGRLS